jgi:EAL and modified HD-GYP domain-containing signal transduction protein
MPVILNQTAAEANLRPGLGTAAAHFSTPPFIQRQPLLDGQCRVVGYELKIVERRPLPVLPGAGSLEQIEDELLLAVAMDLDYQQALNRKFTLLNFHHATLGNPLLGNLPRENTLLGLHPGPPGPELISRCQALAGQGYTFALDETALSSGMLSLARESRYLRLDVSDNDLASLRDRLGRIQDDGGPRLIARNVETEESFAACRKLSFDLYQGYFFTQLRPEAPHGIDTSRLRIMELLNLVMSHAEFPRIEAQFKLDVGLTYRLLRYINSPGVGLRYPIKSIGHVLLMLGHDQLYRWLTLLLFTREGADGRSQSLLRNALIRARFVEILGERRLAPDMRDGLFIVGILSMLDALLNISMEQALASLKLSHAITAALLQGQGSYAPYLGLVVACEDGDQQAISRFTAELGLDSDEINLAHISALIWSEALDF